MRAVAFDLTFTPRKGGGERYQRRHVVIFGNEFAYHVIHTAPEGKLADTAEAFDAVVRSLREEV
jgi:hypothetical protein